MSELRYVIGMCPYCLGAGANEINDSRRAQVCERCNASGCMVFKPHDGQRSADVDETQKLVVCPDCDGDLERVQQACKVCQGRGLELYAGGMSVRICILCEGLTAFRHCTMCEGDGFMQVDAASIGRVPLLGVDWIQEEDGSWVSYPAWFNAML